MWPGRGAGPNVHHMNSFGSRRFKHGGTTDSLSSVDVGGVAWHVSDNATLLLHRLRALALILFSTVADQLLAFANSRAPGVFH